MTFFVQLFIHILYLINSHKCVSFYLVLKLAPREIALRDSFISQTLFLWYNDRVAGIIPRINGFCVHRRNPALKLIK